MSQKDLEYLQMNPPPIEHSQLMVTNEQQQKQNQKNSRDRQYSKFTEQELIDLIKDKPFWINNEQEHETKYYKLKGDCCFNHIVGLPEKNGKCNPMWDYEQDIERRIHQGIKHLWIKKAGGLGITEFFLRYMLWASIAQNKLYKFSQMCIVVGPREQMAIDLIQRAKDILFMKLGFLFRESARTSIRLNHVQIAAYPSLNINAIRALTNPKFILADEADFFVKKDWRDILDAIQRYEDKSDPIIVLVSTPNKPGLMFDTIERDQKQEFYDKIFLSYKVAINKMFTPEQIEHSKRTNPSFEREMNLQYLGRVGNVFNREDIEACITEDYDIESTDPFIPRAAGIDEGFSSSATGIFIQQFRNKSIEVQYADQIENSTPTDIIQKMHRFTNHYHITKHYVDGSQPGFIRDFKRSLGEYEHYEKYTKEELDRKIYHGNMLVCPIQFGNQNDKVLLYHLASIIEKRMMKIHPKFDKFITSLKTAYAEDGDLDKDETSYDDILDAARLAVQNIRFTKQN